MKGLSKSRYIRQEQIQQCNSKNINGIIFIENSHDASSSNNQLIEVKSNKNLTFHSYKRFKSFSYSFQYVYKQSQNEGFYDSCFTQFNASEAIKKGYDYMLFCGGVSSKTKKQIPTIQMIFYQQLVAIQENVVKNLQSHLQVYILAVGEESILDLIGGKAVQLRENEIKFSQNSELTFIDAQKSQPETPYQILQLIKSSLSHRKKFAPLSYFVMYIEVQLKQKRSKKQKIILINSTKDLQGYQKGWDNKTNLVLNKCILSLINKIQNKQTYIPFRDSKLTRIMKPFLTSICKINIIGFVNPVDQESCYHTLNLIKNLSDIKIFKVVRENNESYLNPQMKNSQMHHSRVNQSNRINKKSKTEQVQLLPDKSEKKGIFEKVRQNFAEQFRIQKKLHQVRGRLKIIKKSKQLGLLKINQDLELSRSLQDDQIQYQLRKQKQLLQKNDLLNKQRMETIQNSETITQKLKLLKQYYTLALVSQKEDSNEFLKNQSMINKFYEQKINFIDKQLKKSPMELLMPISKSASIKKQLKAKKTQKQQQKINLPGINQVKKRLSLIKQKVKKGRVQYQNFLSRNVSQYQSYLAQSKQHSILS